MEGRKGGISRLERGNLVGKLGLRGSAEATRQPYQYCNVQKETGQMEESVDVRRRRETQTMPWGKREKTSSAPSTPQ